MYKISKYPLLHTFKIFKAKPLKRRLEATWHLLASVLTNEWG
jgi:hypothetical protein